ncbi:SAM-dependent methyltransferase [Streptomyces jumonjinensis]|uniref:SAM-dependent methyltransferase n=1 Tax=Streptomyces jumonjinensis TaxID=1945 RepID=UPI00379D906F
MKPQHDRAQPPAGTVGPSTARLYNAYQDGKAAYETDRDIARRLYGLGLDPKLIATQNRQFLIRAVDYAARDLGIDQFLDVGCGLPADSGPNVHTVVESVHPHSRILYVDHDPLVLVHADALLRGQTGTTAVVKADLRDPDTILAEARQVLDFTRPIALLLAAVVHFVRDEEQPHALLARLVDALPPGSAVILSHVTDDFSPLVMRQAEALLADEAVQARTRGRTEIEQFLNGLTLVKPGLVPVHQWRQPDTGAASIPPSQVHGYGALGIKPAAVGGRTGTERLGSHAWLIARPEQGVLVVSVGGLVEEPETVPLRERLNVLADESAAALILDLTAVEFLDSAGLGAETRPSPPPGQCRTEAASLGRGAGTEDPAHHGLHHGPLVRGPAEGPRRRSGKAEVAMTGTTTASRGSTTTAPVPLAPVVGGREKLALRLTADGLTGKELARAMKVSPTTARASLTRACRAMEREHPTQAAFAAMVHRLVTADDISGTAPAAGSLRGEDVAVLEHVVSGLTTPQVAAAQGWSTDDAKTVLDVLTGRFQARNLIHLGALALAHDLVPCHLVDDRLPRLPLSALPAPRIPVTLADAMAYARELDNDDVTSSGEQLSHDLLAASYATALPAVLDAGGAGQRAVALARIVCRWLSTAESFRSAASESPAHLRRWDRALSHVNSTGSLSRPLGEATAYAGDVRRLLEAVRDGHRADGVTAAALARDLTALVSSGEHYLGCPVSAYQIARDRDLPRALVEDAVKDLLANRVLEGGIAKAMPAGSLAAQRGHAGVVTDRLRDQLAAGLYPPGSVLPLHDLAVSMCAMVRETRRALQQLADEELAEIVGPSAQVTGGAAHLTAVGRLDPPVPYALPYSPTVITATAREAHDRWRLRRPAAPSAVKESWLTLRRMASQLLQTGRPEDLAVRRAVEAITAPWPANARDRVWHTACLALTVTALQQHLQNTEVPA